MSSKQRFVFALLLSLFVVSAYRLVGFASLFGQESLQLDFSAFYTAGEARSQGLSPYQNHLDRTPPIWDGFALLRHSRFLYPPLSARLFQPLTMMPYAWAKMAWTFLGLACLAGALGLAFRALGGVVTRMHVVMIGTFACLFYPVMTLVERGQVDGMSLLLLVLCAHLSGQDVRRQMAGGACLALALLLKLHCVYFLPFLALQKRWTALAGFAGMAIFLGLVSLGLDGYALHRDYVVEHLPRIARFGEGGTPDQMLPRSVLEPHVRDLQTGYATKDGVRYRQTGFSFVASATLVDVVGSQDSARTSLGLFALFFVPFAIYWLRRSGTPTVFEGWVFWQLALSVVLLCSPTTWVMNTVWMLPALGILIRGYEQADGRVFPLWAGSFGLALAAVPDHHGFVLTLPYIGDWLEYKYAVAQILIAVAMVGLLVQHAKAENKNAKAQGRKGAKADRITG